ncbi:uncharacterized protein [Gorilla gorilla gorilla]|uniref:uncharacterized protein n=1 Tax=Gorilla gorilla gorilla TaxID=9595 RepID=UPI0030090E5C
MRSHGNSDQKKVLLLLFTSLCLKKDKQHRNLQEATEFSELFSLRLRLELLPAAFTASVRATVSPENWTEFQQVDNLHEDKMYCSAMLGILKNKALSSADTQAADFKDWKKSFASSLFSIQTQSVAANVLQMKDRSWVLDVRRRFAHMESCNLLIVSEAFVTKGSSSEVSYSECIRHGSMLENCPKDNQDLLEHRYAGTSVTRPRGLQQSSSQLATSAQWKI